MQRIKNVLLFVCIVGCISCVGAITENNDSKRTNIKKDSLNLSKLVGAWVGRLPDVDIKVVFAAYSDGKTAFALFEKNGTGFPIVGKGSIKNNVLTIEPDDVHKEGNCKKITLHIVGFSEKSISIDLQKSKLGKGILIVKPASEDDLKRYFGSKKPE